MYAFELSLRISCFLSSFNFTLRYSVVARQSPEWNLCKRNIFNCIEMGGEKNEHTGARWVTQSNSINTIDKLFCVQKFPFQIKTDSCHNARTHTDQSEKKTHLWSGIYYSVTQAIIWSIKLIRWFTFSVYWRFIPFIINDAKWWPYSANLK